MDDSESAENARPESEQLPPAAPAVPPRASPAVPPPATIGGPPPTPRCPRCYYSLEGAAPEGTCPECGASYQAADLFQYLAGGGFWRTTGLLLWPLLLTPIAFGCSASAGPVGAAPFLLLLVGNSSVVAFRSLRRGRLRRLQRTDGPVVTAGLYAQSLGCGLLASAAVFALGFAVSCGILLLMFAM